MADKSADKDANHDAQTPFKRLEDFTRRLLAVPKDELEEKMRQEKEAKASKRVPSKET